MSDAEAHDLLSAAWDGGIRYFDTAPHYGHGSSERRLGDFLRDKAGHVISTKVGRLLSPDPAPPPVVHGFYSALPFKQRYDFTHDGVLRSHEDSLQRMGLDRVDILFAHDLGDPDAGTDTDHHRAEFLKGGGHKALTRLKEEGAISAIGIGVNTIEICEELVGRVELDLILLAGRYTLLEQRALERLFPLCEAHGVKIVVGGVFNSGILATGATEGATYNYAPAAEPIMARVREIEAICARHDVPIATAALQYPAQHPLVASTLIGTTKTGSLLRNVAQFEAPVPDALW
ncbi:MAG: aldo/keto reductase, partial [Pseudomonadota bacterium]